MPSVALGGWAGQYPVKGGEKASAQRDTSREKQSQALNLSKPLSPATPPPFADLRSWLSPRGRWQELASESVPQRGLEPSECIVPLPPPCTWANGEGTFHDEL